MATALFWVIWGFASFWLLKTYYYSSSKKKLDQLRYLALVINLAVLGLTLGKIIMTASLLLSTVLLSTRNHLLLKLASTITVFNTFLLFYLMYRQQPTTFTLTTGDFPPIIATLLLLAESVVVLLLWQQLQLKARK